MKRYLVMLFLCVIHVGFGQTKYKQDLDSLSRCLEQLSFHFEEQYKWRGGLKLISKYHPAYVQTDVGDGTEIITEEMVKGNWFYKSVSNNKKSVIIVSSTYPFGGWLVVIDFKQLDTNNIRVSKDTITISDPVKGFKCNVAHRLWKGFIETKTIKLFPKNEQATPAIADKTCYFLRSAALCVK